MLGLLEGVEHAVLDVPYLVASLLVDAANGWVLAIAGLAAGVFSLLPSFPAPPTLGEEILGLVAFFLPIAPMLAVFASFVAIFVTWLGLQVAMRWVKAL